jgi:protein-disulfide isomerase
MTSTPTMKTRRERRLEARLAHRSSPGRRATGSTGRRVGLGTLTIIGLVGGLIAIALAVVLGGQGKAPASSVAIVRAPAGVPGHGFTLGRPDAAVTIDLFEDFQCPACESWGRGVFPRLVQNELADGTVRIVFHNLAFIGPESVAAAHAGYAAQQQGRFWDMWSTLYANQGRENGGAFSRTRLVDMGNGLGLDVARFEADMGSAGAQAALAASIAEADAARVSSTPTLVIAGEAHTGVVPYPEIAAAIAAAMAGR